ncbi:Putative LPS sugar transferase [Gloeomargarita lithophora Alchichica-D10]|uniref:LPS sugar transferase n=1 Tax=Gloeomargarita lithophora Alchichica-D10 TaxID=1188229 RepID=A0A1J0ADJ8_9CYAN|nr:sugar transferase [Gloeomargarita lithophora]APB34012.1 Putative LPS sugar transferase [Gloeomargarita lithophora Alchichica-D10]
MTAVTWREQVVRRWGGWRTLGYGLGLVGVVGLAAQAAWGEGDFWRQGDYLRLAVAVAVTYGTAVGLEARVGRFPGVQRTRVVLVSVSLCFLGLLGVVSLTRWYYSRTFLGVSYGLTLVWQWVLAGWGRRLCLGLVPGELVTAIGHLPGVNWSWLHENSTGLGLDGVVVDLHDALSPPWMRFLADCRLRGLPVHHAATVWEGMTGRVSLAHLGEGLLPAPPERAYLLLKRVGETGLILLALPGLLPLAGLVALAVRWDSPGAVLFWQERMGQGGKPFWMVKFRSMRAQATGAQFARAADQRLTRVGKWIRRFRLDELPQLWHVLRGEMSLIGPRPEQVPFAREFSQRIPYYMCRHLVKPGITGWAQVSQGYAAGVQETRLKLEYDLYYVKYLSLWLDGLILAKTIKTIVTGFGSR